MVPPLLVLPDEDSSITATLRISHPRVLDGGSHRRWRAVLERPRQSRSARPINTAVLTSRSARSSNSAAAPVGQPTRSATMPTARARSLALVTATSIMRLPWTLPSRIITVVLIMLSTSFCAVPAFSRVEPVSTSGPVTTAMAWSARSRMGAGSLLEMAIVNAPRSRAACRAAMTYGVAPLAATPTKASFSPASTSDTSQRARSGSSSAPSMLIVSAPSPPAMSALTRRGETLKVGTHSTASSMASRPLVPAPA